MGAWWANGDNRVQVRKEVIVMGAAGWDGHGPGHDGKLPAAAVRKLVQRSCARGSLDRTRSSTGCRRFVRC